MPTPDITETEKLKSELQAAHDTLAHTSRVAVVGELTASISHEVTQPLAAIIINAQAGKRMLKNVGDDKSALEDTLNDIISDAGRASEIIKLLRKFLQKDDTEKGAVDINSVIEDSVSLLRDEVGNRGVDLALDLPAGIPQLKANGLQLQQVIVNLILNACDAMQVNTTPRVLTLHTGTEAGDLVISVSDTGPGIPAGEEEKLFDMFYSTRDGGMGVGLAISRRIIELHGGTITAGSNAGQGAEFRIVLPICR